MVAAAISSADHEAQGARVHLRPGGASRLSGYALVTAIDGASRIHTGWQSSRQSLHGWDACFPLGA